MVGVQMRNDDVVEIIRRQIQLLKALGEEPFLPGCRTARSSSLFFQSLLKVVDIPVSTENQAVRIWIT